METTLTAIEQYQVTEVELIYKTKVKASKRSQILHSRDIYEVFIQSWDKPHCLRRGWPLPETYLKRNYGIDDFIPPKSGRMYAASNINGNANDFLSMIFVPNQIKT